MGTKPRSDADPKQVFPYGYMKYPYRGGYSFDYRKERENVSKGC